MAARDRRGFTLLEAIVASFGVAIGLAGILVAFTALMRTARLTDEVQRSLHTARDQMEYLRTCSFSSSELRAGTNLIAGGRYVVTSNAVGTLRQVVLTVDVIVPNNATSQVTLTTLMASAFQP